MSKMQIRRDRKSGLEVHLVGDFEQDNDELVVVLMHGFGAPTTDLVGLAADLACPPGTRFAFPGAPLPVPALGGTARAWWPVDLAHLQNEYLAGRAEQLWQEEPAGIGPARDSILDLLDELTRKTPRAPLVVGGFSQGGILAADLAFRTPRALDGLVLLSIAPIAEATWVAGMQDRKDLRVYQSHGRFDPLLPFEAGVRVREQLQLAGLSVEFVEFPGMHGIAQSVLDELGKFLRQIRGIR